MIKKINIKDCLYSAMFTAIISVLGLVSISVPFNPVPITGQTLGVMLAGSILTVRQTTLSILTFLLLGIVGIPVFAGGTSGLGILIGPRGGYLVGFLIGAIMISLLRGSKNNLLRIGISNFIGGIIVIYFFGISWRMIVTGMGLYPAIISNLPYVPGDIFKVLAATLVAVAVNKQLGRFAWNG